MQYIFAIMFLVVRAYVYINLNYNIYTKMNPSFEKTCIHTFMIILTILNIKWSYEIINKVIKSIMNNNKHRIIIIII